MTEMTTEQMQTVIKELNSKVRVLGNMLRAAISCLPPGSNAVISRAATTGPEITASAAQLQTELQRAAK